MGNSYLRALPPKQLEAIEAHQQTAARQARTWFIAELCEAMRQSVGPCPARAMVYDPAFAMKVQPCKA
jgi:hypothetical protein